ncbi:phage tail protein [Pseudomonas oryzihabitans]|uniref:phage tail protein n=1 Tax=Pseudomonas oryzihabitans TaxID=47885 RepID=UPI00119DB144|nr:phage tail protein [Pseudomonas oryzihabitans]
MPEVFIWRPDSRAAPQFQQRTRSAQFGDGYKQEAGDGLNTETQSWPLTFTGSKARIIEIVTFLRSRQGAQSFYWTTPFGEKLLFRCKAYNPAHVGGTVWQLTATFEQSFQP